MKMFAEQVKNMQAAGVSRIDTMAARMIRPGGAMQPFVGYKVWPKFGYDAEIPEDVWNKLPRELKPATNHPRAL